MRDRVEHLEAVEPRHLHVEENQVGLLFSDERGGFLAVHGFGRDRHMRMALQVQPHPLTGERLVVGDDRPETFRQRFGHAGSVYT